ncbi:mobile mystery protein B [Rhodomicrobium lacus]|uniref:mobile mystery protein B n=1 Tax=Rhodomicrobium lacus TaxID=2498452 RepID=UPI000F8DCCC0|nr:mobile mystery protein B [Rhodomicrobium lacus]
MTGVMDYPEGATPLDPDEMQGLKYRHITTRGELDELEQVNIESGLLWLSRQRQKDLLTDDFAITLHKKLFGDVWKWAGTFRRTGKNIGIDPRHIGVELRMLLQDARYWADNGTFDPVEAAVRLHHRMVFIHPFPNGNGRHARIMADAVLTHVYGERPIDWSGGSDLQRMNARRLSYIAALRAADRGDLEPLLAFAGYGER